MIGQTHLCNREFDETDAELVAIGLALVDAGGRFIFVNRWLCDLLGYAREELLALSVKQVSHPEDRDMTDEVRARLRSGEIKFFRVEKRNLRKDGSTVWVGLTIAEKRGPTGEPLYDISVYEDITARKEAEARIQYLATHDCLTGLPNRAMFGQMLRQAIESARRHERELALLFIDLDGFKAVNDTHGHEAGDKLLQEISMRLKDALRSSDLIARLGGDEFVVLLPEPQGAHEVAAVAHKVLRAALRTVAIDGRECRVTASIGISMYPGDARDAHTLMKTADAAMYFAKENGKNDFHFYATEVPSASIPAQARTLSSASRPPPS